MILRIKVDGRRWSYDDIAREWRLLKPRLMGVGRAGFGYLMEELPAPAITSHRARFYFTQKGWHTFGRHIFWAARQQGHTVQVRRRRRPPASQIVFEDEYQMAVLPARRANRNGQRGPDARRSKESDETCT